MNRSIEERIRTAFEVEYEPPLADLRQGFGKRRRLPRNARWGRLAAAVAVAAVVTAAISVPRLLGLGAGPTTANPRGWTTLVPNFGYVIVATAENLSGRGGTQLLGVEPPGRYVGFLVESQCIGGKAGQLPGKVRGLGVVVGTKAGTGTGFFIGAPSSGSSCVTPGVGGGLEDAKVGQPTRIYVTAAPGMRWRVAMEVARGSVLPRLPKTLGSCPTQQLGWGFQDQNRGGSLILTLNSQLQRAPGTASPASCHLVVPVRLGLYYAGTEQPIAGSGASFSTGTMVGNLGGSSKGALTQVTVSWSWANWCGGERTVQAVFFGPDSAVLIDATLGGGGGPPPPLCHSGAKGLELSPQK